MASSTAEGAAHQPADCTLPLACAVLRQGLPNLALDDLRRQAKVIAIVSQFQPSAFILARSDGFFRSRFPLPSPKVPEGRMQEGRDGSDFTTLDQACDLSHAFDGGGRTPRQPDAFDTTLALDQCYQFAAAVIDDDDASLRRLTSEGISGNTLRVPASHFGYIWAWCQYAPHLP